MEWPIRPLASIETAPDPRRAPAQEVLFGAPAQPVPLSPVPLSPIPLDPFRSARLRKAPLLKAYRGTFWRRMPHTVCSTQSAIAIC